MCNQQLINNNYEKMWFSFTHSLSLSLSLCIAFQTLAFLGARDLLSCHGNLLPECFHLCPSRTQIGPDELWGLKSTGRGAKYSQFPSTSVRNSTVLAVSRCYFNASEAHTAETVGWVQGTTCPPHLLLQANPATYIQHRSQVCEIWGDAVTCFRMFQSCDAAVLECKSHGLSGPSSHLINRSFAPHMPWYDLSQRIHWTCYQSQCHKGGSYATTVCNESHS